MVHVAIILHYKISKYTIYEKKIECMHLNCVHVYIFSRDRTSVTYKFNLQEVLKDTLLIS